MRCERPEVLWLLLLALPALLGFFWWSWRKRRELISQFVQSRLLAVLTVGVSAQRQKMRLALLTASVGLLIFVLARPQWGYDWEEARQRGLDVFVAIDTSRSMLADDLPPNRLERAKLAAFDLKRLARADRMGLVAFAGSAFLQCPLTLDDEPFRLSVNALDVNIIPQGGTALAEAIQCALGAFKEKSDNQKILVLLSDGEDHDGNALDAAREAAKAGLRIFTVGIGTPKGEVLRATDNKGRTNYMMDNEGHAVVSKLNEDLLTQIAKATGGFYLRFLGADTMDMLYERGLAPLPKAQFSAKRVQRWHERYQWFLGLTLMLLVIEMFLPERKRVRRTPEMLAATTNEELRKAMALLLALMVPALAFASSATAKKKYEAGRYESALSEYQRLLRKKPNDARLHYNTGATAYQAQDYEEAAQELNLSLNSPDVVLQQRAYYNLGSTHYRRGESLEDLSQKQAAWQEAVTSYENALQLNPQDADAKYNLEFVKKKLEELQKQQPQQNKDNQDKKDDQKNQQDKQKQDQPKSDQDKQNQQNQPKPDQKPDAAQNQQQQNQQPQQQAPQPPNAAPQNPGDKTQEKPEDPADAQANRAAVIRMTPQQAMQLLDSIKDDEKLMPFQLEQRTNRLNRVFKDW